MLKETGDSYVAVASIGIVIRCWLERVDDGAPNSHFGDIS